MVRGDHDLVYGLIALRLYFLEIILSTSAHNTHRRHDGSGTAPATATANQRWAGRRRCSERESQSESDGETKIGRNKPRVAFTSRTRTEGSVGHEGTTDALQNGEVLKNESWNEWVSRPVPKALPGFRKGEDEPENTKLERSYQEPQAR
ncbi:hypothetical protein C8F01DRAFT_1088228 [Mycena amicta]|nr:hypothetical protein C8F01DRAFT_1088228 [Mycena amicta]